LQVRWGDFYTTAFVCSQRGIDIPYTFSFLQLPSFIVFCFCCFVVVYFFIKKSGHVWLIKQAFKKVVLKKGYVLKSMLKKVLSTYFSPWSSFALKLPDIDRHGPFHCTTSNTSLSRATLRFSLGTSNKTP